MSHRDLARDVQTKASSGQLSSLRAPEEALEDQAALGRQNRSTRIRHHDPKVPSIAFQPDIDYRFRRRILTGVIQQLAQRELKEFHVRENLPGRALTDKHYTSALARN